MGHHPEDSGGAVLVHHERPPVRRHGQSQEVATPLETHPGGCIHEQLPQVNGPLGRRALPEEVQTPSLPRLPLLFDPQQNGTRQDVGWDEVRAPEQRRQQRGHLLEGLGAALVAAHPAEDEPEAPHPHAGHPAVARRLERQRLRVLQVGRPAQRADGVEHHGQAEHGEREQHPVEQHHHFNHGLGEALRTALHQVRTEGPHGPHHVPAHLGDDEQHLEDEHGGDVPASARVHDGALGRAVDEHGEREQHDGEQREHAHDVGAHQVAAARALPGGGVVAAVHQRHQHQPDEPDDELEQAGEDHVVRGRQPLAAP